MTRPSTNAPIVLRSIRSPRSMTCWVPQTRNAKWSANLVMPLAYWDSSSLFWSAK